MTDPITFRSVYFDCDSTLAAIEGIDRLAAMRDEPTRERLTELTDRAMRGELPLEAVYGARLDVVRPTRSEVEDVGQQYIDAITPDTELVVAALVAAGKHVAVVSGGLLPPVARLAEHLGIAEVHAVGIEFADDGSYVSYDRASPLARGGGKIDVMASVAGDKRPVCLIGDGATDLEASSVVDRFVGFGGVTVRQLVREQAAHFIRENSLAPLLPLVLTAEERERLRGDDRFTELLERA